MEGKGGLKELFFGFMDMLSKWMALSGLLLGCLPVVTAGASWAAAYYTAVKAVRRHRNGIWGCYWHSFRQNLKQGIVFSLLMLAVGGLLVFYRFAISGVAAMLLACVFLTAMLPPLILLLPGLHCWGASFLQEPVLRKLAKDNQALGPEDDPWYAE